MSSSYDDLDFPEELLDTCTNFRNDIEEMLKVLEPLKTLQINSTDLQELRYISLATKSSNKLPKDNDFDYYSTFKGFQMDMQNQGQLLLSFMTLLIQKQNIRNNFQGNTLEEKFDLLKEVNGVIIENIRNCLDEASDLKKSEEELVLAVKPQITINTSWNKKMDRIECAKLHLLQGFALNSMYHMYLTTCGINPRKHKVKDEVEKYRYVFNGIGDAMRKKKGITMMDKDAAEKEIRHILWTYKNAKASDASSNSKEQNKSMREPTAEEHEEEPITKKCEKEPTTEKCQRAPIREKHEMEPSTSKETREKSKKRRQ